MKLSKTVQRKVIVDELRKLTDRIGPAARKDKSGSGAEELIGVLRQIRELLAKASLVKKQT